MREKSNKNILLWWSFFIYSSCIYLLQAQIFNYIGRLYGYLFRFLCGCFLLSNIPLFNWKKAGIETHILLIKICFYGGQTPALFLESLSVIQ